MGIRVYGYARKSPDEKEDTETSILNQTRLIELICERNEWELVEVFTDSSSSGSDRNRRYFNEMIQKTKDGLVEHIVVKEQDRFCRDSSFFRDTLFDLDAYGKKVFSILNNKFLSHEDLGDKVKSMVDENVIIEGRRKAKSLFEQKMRDRLPPIKAPFGYKNDTKKKIWVIHPKESLIVKELIVDYLSGKSYKEALEKFKISKGIYYRIIDNAKKGLYSGFVVYSHKIKDSKGNFVREDEVKYEGIHEPIITKELWEKINSQ